MPVVVAAISDSEGEPVQSDIATSSLGQGTSCSDNNVKWWVNQSEMSREQGPWKQEQKNKIVVLNKSSEPLQNIMAVGSLGQETSSSGSDLL